MTHEEVLESLLEFAWGELPAARALEVERHLETCASCTREQVLLTETRRMAAPLSELEEPSPGFDDRILAAARAEASLRADGTPGAVIEATGSVRPAGIEPAIVDPLAPVHTAKRGARPRRALRWAAFSSVAAAAVLVLAVTSTRSSKRAEPAVESSAYEIHIKAPQQQPAIGVGVGRAAVGATGNAAAAPAPALATTAPPSAADAKQKPQSEQQRRARERSRPEATRQLGGGGDISSEVAADESAPGRAADARAATAAGVSPPAGAATSRKATAEAAGSLSVLSGAVQSATSAPAAEAPAVAPAAKAPAMAPAAKAPAVAPAAKAPAVAPAAAAPAPDSESAAEAGLSPVAIEDAARKSRREANYALAAAQYRKAAQLRRLGPDPSTAAWDLAHAVECLSAISQWNEARGVRQELLRLYPAEQSAAAAAARALRPAEIAPPSSNDSPASGK